METHELYIEDTGSENSPPMFGGLCCRMAAMPYCCEEPVMSGQVKISGKQVIFKEMYASLMDWQLSIWNNKEQKESARRPVYVIPISRDTCVLENDDSAISITNEAQTWIVQLENSDDKVRREHPFSFFLMTTFFTLKMISVKVVNVPVATCCRSSSLENCSFQKAAPGSSE